MLRTVVDRSTSAAGANESSGANAARAPLVEVVVVVVKEEVLQGTGLVKLICGLLPFEMGGFARSVGDCTHRERHMT